MRRRGFIYAGLIGTAIALGASVSLRASRKNLRGLAYRSQVLQGLRSGTIYPNSEIGKLIGAQGIPSESEFLARTKPLMNLTSFPIEKFDEAIFAAKNPDPANPSARLQWDLTPAAVAALTDEVITRYRAILDQIGKVPKGQRTWATVAQPLADWERQRQTLSIAVEFPMHVSPDKAIRDASSDASQKLSAFAVEAGQREDVYLAFKDLAESAEGKSLTGEKARYVERTLRDFRRNGLGLAKEKLDRIKTLQERMSTLSIEFSKNTAEENTTFLFTKQELEGVPESDLERFKKASKEEGKYLVSLKYPDYNPVMKSCKVEATRKTLEYAFNNRCAAENGPKMEELARLRHEHAQLLGYPNHAAYVLEIRMAKTSEKVQTFLQNLSKGLEPLALKELAVLRGLKEAEKKERKEPYDGKINMWDFRYYTNMVEEKNYNVDHEALKQYFPQDIVTKGLFDIYQRILGLRFNQRKPANAWHPDVTLWDVADATTGSPVGQFYMDLYPRDGKYGHAAVFGLIPATAIDFEGKQRQLPVAAMVCNFPPPKSDGTYAGLSHTDVVTFFHEFGHVMHQLCSEAKLAEFAGTAVERDFVEAPSQMLENWCWSKESLRLMSGKSKDPNAKLPEDMMEKLIKSKEANQGLLAKRQLVFGLLDQEMHSGPLRNGETLSQMVARVQDTVMHVPTTPGTNFIASFGHLAGGYDASYYGYMWSEVFSMDMFTSRFEKNVLNAESGMAYRKKILAPGGSKDAIDMLKDFLGREPSDKAFLKSKGLVSDALDAGGAM